MQFNSSLQDKPTVNENNYLNTNNNNNSVSTKCDQCGEIKDKVSRCSLCLRQQYCSKECQKLAWPEHKKVCIQKIQEKIEQSNKKCSQCGKTDVKIKKCSSCLSEQYCSKECQKLAWPQHQKTCDYKQKKPSEEKNEREKQSEDDVPDGIKKNLQNILNSNYPPLTQTMPFLPKKNPKFMNWLTEIEKDRKMLDTFSCLMRILEMGYIDYANQEFSKLTFTRKMNEDYFKKYIKKLFTTKGNHLNEVIENGKKWIGQEEKVRAVLVDELCALKIFKEAYQCAKGEIKAEKQLELLTKLSVALKNINKNDLANFVLKKEIHQTEEQKLLSLLKRKNFR